LLTFFGNAKLLHRKSSFKIININNARELKFNGNTPGLNVVVGVVVVGVVVVGVVVVAVVVEVEEAVDEVMLMVVEILAVPVVLDVE
jgi:hypothetical protein